MKKKSLIYVALICVISMLLFSCIVVLPTPEEKNIEISAAVVSSLNTIRKDYYNKDEYKENPDVPTPSDFYVEIGDVGVSSDPEVTVGDTTFISTDMINLSIGNSAFIKDNVYMIKGGKIYIASPVLQMELSKEDPNIEVGIKAIYKTDFSKDLAELKVDGVYWDLSTSTSLGEVKLNENKTEATIVIPSGTLTKAGQTMLGIDFRYGEGNKAPEFYITKKDVVRNSDKRGSGKTYNYGTTGTDGIKTSGDSEGKQQMLGFYPYGWVSEDAFNNGTVDAKEYSKELEYKCKGCIVEGDIITVVASGSIDIELSRATAETPTAPEGPATE